MGNPSPASPLEDLWALVTIIFSALTYLLDFSSNIATASEYHHMVKVHPSWIGIFIGMVTVMAIAHIANAVIFKVELKKEDQPLKTAYLFPLMQLSRLVQALWRTCSWKGLGNLKADDQNTLYSILSVSLETGPQLTLQFVVFVLYYRKTLGRPPKTLLVSILASFLSGSVNGGLAILAVSYTKARNSPPSWRVKMVGFITSGLFTTAALFLQCWTYTVQMLWGYYNGYPIAAYITVEFSFHFILFMSLLRRREPSASNALTRICNAKRLLHCFVLSYLSPKIGTLQPLTSDSRIKDELGRAVYWYKLLLASATQLCLHAGVFLLSLVGPPYLRWSNMCPMKLSILPPDDVMGFPCRWYVPAITVGMLMYCFTIVSHIALDNYVNKRIPADRSTRNHYDHSNKEAGDTDLERVAQNNHNSLSMHRKSHIVNSKVSPIESDIDEGHKDDDSGDNETEGLEKGCVCQVLSTTPEDEKGELETDHNSPSMYSIESWTTDDAVEINQSVHTGSHSTNMVQEADDDDDIAIIELECTFQKESDNAREGFGVDDTTAMNPECRNELEAASHSAVEINQSVHTGSIQQM